MQGITDNFALTLRRMDELQTCHVRRHTVFVVPSVVQPGVDIQVQRIDDNPRPVSSSDLHFLMHAHVSPDKPRVVSGCTGRPPNRFIVTVSSVTRNDAPVLCQ